MALEWLDCADGGLGLLGPRTAHAGGCFGRIRGLGLLWPSLGWRLALQGVWGLGIRGLLWGCLTAPKSSTPPVLFVISLALHGATADQSEVSSRSRIVLIELQRLQVADLQGSSTGGDDLAPFLQVDFQHPYKSN